MSGQCENAINGFPVCPIATEQQVENAALKKLADAAAAIKYMVGVDVSSQQSYLDRDRFFSALREAGYL